MNQNLCTKCGALLQEEQAFCPKCGQKRELIFDANMTASQVAVATKKSGLTTAAFILGIVAISTSLLPIINKASFIIGILAFVFGLVTIFKVSSKAKPIIAIILGVLSIVLTIASQNYYSKAIKTAQQNLEERFNNIDNMFGDQTDKILEKYLDVNIGKFVVDKGDYIDKTKLNIIVKNKSDKKRTFTIKIEAVDKNGARLDTAMVFAQDLNAGQSMNLEAFTYVMPEDIEKLKNATFKILEVSTY